LNLMGPVSQKVQAKLGKPLEQAQDVSFVQAAGSAGRHMLTGGRKSLLTLVENDRQAIAWIRVTDGDPCSFCAMLASRGPVFLDKKAFDESDHGPGLHRKNPGPFDGPGTVKVHDNCACTMEPVYSRSAPWPGRAREFRNLWREVVGFAPNNKYSGKDALNAYRRAYEAMQRDNRRSDVA
jgi:hypothetical protein